MFATLHGQSEDFDYVLMYVPLICRGFINSASDMQILGLRGWELWDPVTRSCYLFESSLFEEAKCNT